MQAWRVLIAFITRRIKYVMMMSSLLSFFISFMKMISSDFLLAICVYDAAHLLVLRVVGVVAAVVFGAVGGGVDGGVGRWMAVVWGLGAGGACLAVSSGQFTCGWQLAERRRWAATRGARFRFTSSSPLVSLTSNPRRLGESWGRTSVREDCMKEFKEVGRIMNLRRLGGRAGSEKEL